MDIEAFCPSFTGKPNGERTFFVVISTTNVFSGNKARHYKMAE